MSQNIEVRYEGQPATVLAEEEHWNDRIFHLQVGDKDGWFFADDDRITVNEAASADSNEVSA